MPTPGFITNLRAGRPQHLITYGTSLTAGGAWPGLLLEALLAQFGNLPRLTNSGRGSMWSTWGVENLEERVLAKAPDAVTLEFAINDAFLPYATTPALCRANLENMIQRIAAGHPACQIILQTMNPPTGRHLDQRPNFRAYYQVYHDVARERGLLLIDHTPAWETLLVHQPEVFNTYVPDGIHPAPIGCANLIVPNLLQALSLLSPPPHHSPDGLPPIRHR